MWKGLRPRARMIRKRCVLTCCGAPDMNLKCSFLKKNEAPSNKQVFRANPLLTALFFFLLFMFLRIAFLFFWRLTCHP